MGRSTLAGSIIRGARGGWPRGLAARAEIPAPQGGKSTGKSRDPRPDRGGDATASPRHAGVLCVRHPPAEIRSFTFHGRAGRGPTCF